MLLCLKSSSSASIIVKCLQSPGMRFGGVAGPQGKYNVPTNNLGWYIHGALLGEMEKWQHHNQNHLTFSTVFQSWISGGNLVKCSATW